MKILYLFLLIIAIYYVSKSREGYSNTISDNKEVRKKIFHGLNILDKIFNKHKIYYTIAYGTLLGAVRHWDMIQWDDDADVHILRKDIDKIMELKDEFAKYGITLKKNWKLLKLYFNDTEYPFIDLFPIDNIEGETKRCCPKSYKCKQILQKWWTSWYDFPYEWIKDRIKLKFGKLTLWAPKKYIKLLKFWYGPKCLTQCYSNPYNHMTGKFSKSKLIKCKNLPKPQI